MNKRKKMKKTKEKMTSTFRPRQMKSDINVLHTPNFNQ
uniref:Uncharacterized protein n=1 Tax=Brugia malayi TaxID=6279 RepID=A0A912GZK3_BRUMA